MVYYMDLSGVVVFSNGFRWEIDDGWDRTGVFLFICAGF